MRHRPSRTTGSHPRGSSAEPSARAVGRADLPRQKDTDPMSSSEEFDLVVLGAGPVGENAADYAAKRGLSVAIVEEELVGGECSYWACQPSKALLRSGNALAAARRVQGAAQAVTGDLDVAGVLRRRDRAVSDWDDSGQVAWLDGAGITLLRGHGRITGVREVEVDGRRVR